MHGRLLGKEGSDRGQVDLHVVRVDVVAVADAIKELVVILLHALDERKHPATLYARILVQGKCPVHNVNGGVGLVRPGLPAIEHPCAAPHLAQAAHRHTTGTDRTRAGRNRTHKEHSGTGRAVRLNRHFIGNVGGRHAPVRQSTGVRVNIDENRIIIAVPALAGQRVNAILRRILVRHVDRNLS